MDKQTALKILELDNSANSEQINQAFRKLAKKYHPDKNQNDPSAEAKFKEINSAYQYLQNPESEQSFSNPFSGSNPFQNINDLFNQHFPGANNSFFNNIPQVPINYTTISFAESILGVDKTLEIEQIETCNSCKGSGAISTVDSCKQCNGKGRTTSPFSRGAVVIMQSCHFCGGSGKIQNPCTNCGENGYIYKKSNSTIRIPGGVPSGADLRIPGGILRINVESDPDMILSGKDVLSNLEISLLDALKGNTFKVRTVKGEMNLKVPAKIKNLDLIKINNYGVNGEGNHIFNIKVKYPEDVSNIINILEKNEIN